MSFSHNSIEAPMFLLDTGILLGLAREAHWAGEVSERLKLHDPESTTFTSVVCHGEILAIAEKNGWGASKRRTLEGILDTLPRLDINKRDILDAYARIDAWTHGKPVVAPGSALPPKPARSMTKNDLWIAAFAHVTRSVLVTTDKDFDHMDGIWLKREFVETGR